MKREQEERRDGLPQGHEPPFNINLSPQGEGAFSSQQDSLFLSGRLGSSLPGHSPKEPRREGSTLRKEPPSLPTLFVGDNEAREACQDPKNSGVYSGYASQYTMVGIPSCIYASPYTPG